MQNQNNKMHPEDKKNLIVFFIACVSVFFLYDHFIYKPQLEKIEAYEAAQASNQAAPEIGAAQQEQLAPTGPITTQDALNSTQRVEIESDTLTGSLSLQGARFDYLTLNNYFETVDRIKPVPVLAPAKTEFPQYADFGWITNDSSIEMPNHKSVWRITSKNKTLSPEAPITLQWVNPQGMVFIRDISLDKDYLFTVTDRVQNNSGRTVSIFPYSMISRVGHPKDLNRSPILHEGPIAYLDEELYEASFVDLDDEPREVQINQESRNGWIGISEKYWLTAFLPAQNTEARFRIDAKGTGDKTRYQTDYTGSAVSIENGQSHESTMRFYAGPKIVGLLESYAEKFNIPHFDLAVDFGMFYFMTRPFFTVLTWIGHSTGSFALAILIFTVILRLAVFPLANKSFRSFARMRKLTPQMVELREKYGKDREKLQKEIFALYQKEQVNPMAGCLPILIQIPIFFSLYKVLYITLEMRHTPFWGWIDDMSALDPTTMFNLFGLIPWDPPSFLMIGAWPLLMCITLLAQQRLNPPPQDPVQAKMMALMPVFMTFILASFPAGLVIYWTWSNCLSVIQQYVLMRSEGADVSFFRRTKAEEKLEHMVEDGPAGISPAAEMIEDEIEHAIEGDDGEDKPVIKKKKPTKKKKK